MSKWARTGQKQSTADPKAAVCGAGTEGKRLVMISDSPPTQQERLASKLTPQPDDAYHEVERYTLKDHIARFGEGTTFHGVRFVTDYKVHFLRR